MPRSKSGDTLQIDEHLRFQRVLGIAQRIGWGALLLIAVVAVSGALGGGGPLSRATAHAEALQVRYPRFAHSATPVQIELEVATDAIERRPFAITLGGGYADRLQIDHVVPQPERAWSANHGLTFQFAAAPGRRQVVRIAGKFGAPGMVGGEVSLEQRPPIRLRSFIYP